MKISYLLKFAVCVFAFTMLMTSCGKENIEEVEETVEEIQPVILITLNGVTTQYTAYAAYCEINGATALSVSNNPDILDNEFWNTGSLAEDDFVVHYRTDGTTTTSMGGAVFNSDFMGQPILAFVQDTEADVTINDANSTAVSGGLSGTFFTGVPGPNTTTVDYSVDFLAEVDASLTPLFCY